MKERISNGPSGHLKRLLELGKDDLADEVIRTWDTLAGSEAELSELRITVERLEVEIAKMRGRRGISSTKIEMANRIEELEKEVSILSIGTGDEELARLREREEALLTALLDLEREFTASQNV